MIILVLSASRMLVSASWITDCNDAALKHGTYSNKDVIHIISRIIRYVHRGRGGVEMSPSMSTFHKVYRKANTLAPDGKLKPPKLHDPGEQPNHHMGRGTKTQRPTWMTWRLLWLMIHGSWRIRHKYVRKRAALNFYCHWINVAKRSYTISSCRWTNKYSLVPTAGGHLPM